MVGWHHQLDGHRFGWTPRVGDGQGGLAYCSPWGHKEANLTEWLNWTEQVYLLCCMGDIPRRGIKPVSLVSSALAGGFITTEPPGSSPFFNILKNWSIVDLQYCVRVRYEWSESHSIVSNSLWSHGLYSPWNSLGQNTGVGSLSCHQGIFPTQGWNPGLPHCRWILYQLNHSIVIQLYTHTHTHTHIPFYFWLALFLIYYRAVSHVSI